MVENIPYFVRGHTAEGLVNFSDSNLQGIETIIALQHDNKQLIADVIKYFKKNMEGARKVETIYSPYLGKQLEGLILRDKSYALLSADVLLKKEIVRETIDLNNWLPMYVDEEVKKSKNNIQDKAYHCFKQALTIHDELEQVYIDEMDFSKADKLAEHVLNDIFADVPMLNKQAHVYKRLFGTNTIEGAINEVEQIIEPIKHRVFIKGRAGTGKSVLLKKVLKECVRLGYDVELHHCSFDPQSIDMVLIRDLNYCLFDSTAPHEFFPTRATDQIVDLYETTVTKGTDEKYAEKIAQITQAYQKGMRDGLDHLYDLRTLSLFTSLELSRAKYVKQIENIVHVIKQTLN